MAISAVEDARFNQSQDCATAKEKATCEKDGVGRHHVESLAHLP
jgi:hypothetical protein